MRKDDQSDPPSPQLRDGSATPPPEIVAGDSVGRYTVRSFIGAGGMGRVFAADDIDLGRTVALKLMHPDRRDPRARSRLIREAQTLARLRHPNVVTIYDVGKQGDDVFLAMELIEGETLTEWLRRGPRSWREVQGVFLAAGRGLAAAHAVGIVHRDFKPQNVVVGKERVVVVDFGLARAGAVGPDADDSASVEPSEVHSIGDLTLSGEHPGTPLYMAPEQGMGGAVTAKADQFAFCFALREALKAQPAGAPIWLQQLIARGLSPRPEDRWPSMAALLAVLRHAFWTPRRQRLAALAGVCAVAAVGVAAFALGRQAAAPDPCPGAEAAVAPMWDDATRDRIRETFRHTGRPYADDTFARVDASLRRHLGDWATAHRDACEAAQVRHDPSEALLDARMVCLGRARLEVGALIALLGNADADTVDHATEAADRAGDVSACADGAALPAAVPPPRDPAAAREVEAMRGEIAQLSALRLLAKSEDGRTAARRILERARAVGYAPVLALALELAAWFEVNDDHFDLAIAFAYEAARVAGEAHDDATVASALNLVAFSLGAGKHRFDAAETAYHSAVIAAARAGNPMPLLRRLYGNRVTTLQQSGEYAIALPLSLVGLGLSLQLHGVDSYQAASSLMDISALLNHIGDLDDARRLCERALATAEKALGPEHPIVNTIVVIAGNNRLGARDYDGAAPYYERALLAFEHLQGADDLKVALAANNLSIARYQQRRLPEARALVERGLRIRAAKLGPEHPLVAKSYSGRAEVARLEGRSDEALADLERALAIQRAAYAGPHPSLADTYREQASLLVSLGRLNEARAALAQADEIEAKVGGDRGDRAGSLGISADIARAAHRPREAIALYRRALPLVEASGPQGPELLDALLGMGEAQLHAGDAADALATAERAVAIATDIVVPVDVTWAAQFLLAQARWAQDRDRAGAIMLAKNARARLAALDYPTATIAKIDHWLSQHPH